MRYLFLLIFSFFFLFHAYSQGERIFAGNETYNFGTLDISINNGVSWSTERSSLPGYFSLLQHANFIGYSNQANIDGYVKKIGNTSFIFPVGTGKQLRALEISEPIAPTDAYATAWIEGNPDNDIDPTGPNAGRHSTTSVSGLITAISKVGQWDWQVGENNNLGKGTTGNGAGIKITVSIPDMTGFAATSELRLVGWKGSSWIDLSGKQTATGIVENSKLSGIMIPGISAIAIGKISSNSITLLKSFYAISSACSTILKWETIYENSFSKFIIEESRDGFNFNPITSISAIGNSTGNKYSKQVEQQFGKSYYRMKIINSESGTYNYSHIFLFDKKCNDKDMEGMQIYPNPFLDYEDINIRFTTFYSGEGILSVLNSSGQIVFNKSVQIKEGLNILKPDFKNIPHGNLLVKITKSNGQLICLTKQLIKQ